MKYLIIALIILVLGAGAVYFIFMDSGQTQDQTFSQPPATRNTDTQNPNPTPPPPTKRDTSARILSLSEKNNSGISGDGNMQLKGTIVQVGIKITGAPLLAAGQWYEVFVTNADGSITSSIGRMTQSTSESGTYVLGSQGQESWFDFDTVLVSRESKDDQKPDQVVAEGKYAVKK